MRKSTLRRPLAGAWTTLGARARRWLAPAALAAVGLAASTPDAAAQTRFEWAAEAVDYARYTRPEECLAAVGRVAEQLEWRARTDTLPYDGNAALPDSVVAVARGCGSRFTAAATPPSSHSSLVDLYLIMGRADEAQALVREHLAAVPASDVPERAIRMSQAIAGYLRARPALVQPAQVFARELDGMGSRVRQYRVNAHLQLYQHAQSIMDVDLMNAEGGALIAAADGLTDEEWMTSAVQEAIADAIISTTLPLLRDSTAAGYLAALEERMRRTLGDSYGTRGAGSIGQKAVPLTGDFWFRRDDSAVARPAPGRISLVIRVDHRCDISCFPNFAVMRRLHQRYGAELDITLVGITAGYFNLRPPVTPAQEAEAMRELFHDEFRLPGALTVSTTPFVHRPDPDGRRVDRAVHNDTTYAFGISPDGNPVAVVDDQGRIIYYTGSLRPRKEREITALLDFLIARHRRAAAPTSAGAGAADASREP